MFGFFAAPRRAREVAFSIAQVVQTVSVGRETMGPESPERLLRGLGASVSELIGGREQRQKGHPMASTTRLVKTAKIAWSGMNSPLIRLMMFVNDAGIINKSLHEWDTTTDKQKQARKGSARSFFARLQMAYVFEALQAIKDIRENKEWMTKVEQCPKGTQDHFAKVCAFLDSPDYKTLTILRNNACFHYADKWSVKAVEEIATKNLEDQSKFSQGDGLLDWYFELGDKVAQRIIVHYVFTVEEGKDIGKESDAIANRIFDAAEEIALFAGAFIQEQIKG
jgi:hypothetical protein